MIGFDLLVFDCDGVLIDSERIAISIDARELTAHGITISEQEIFDRFSGMTYAEMYCILQAETGVQLPVGYAERTHALVLDACISYPALAVPGAAEALDTILLPKCVASSSSSDWLARTLGAANLLHRFKPHIFSAAQVARGKPAPDLFLYAASRMAVVPTRCLVIEDSVAGVTAAVAAGMSAIGFVGTAINRKEQKRRLCVAGATTVFSHMLELPEILAQVDIVAR